MQEKCSTLQDGVRTNETSHFAQIAAAERELGNLSTALQMLQTRADALTAFASRVGARLQTVDAQRQRAQHAAQSLQHLAAFARSQDLSTLPDVYNDDERMEEAAKLAVQLSTAVEKALNSNTNNTNSTTTKEAEKGNSTTPPRASPPRRRGPPPPGTLDAAAEQLELYRNVLDNRVVSRFDTAAASQDFTVMATCARMMATSGPHGDSLLISRYISTRPMFAEDSPFSPSAFPQKTAAVLAAAAATTPPPQTTTTTTTTTNSAYSSPQKPPLSPSKTPANTTNNNNANNANASGLFTPPPPTTTLSKTASTTTTPTTHAHHAAAAMRALTELFAGLSTTLREEAVVIEQVFPTPPTAVAALTERIFEEIIQNALEYALAPPEEDATLEELRAHLTLLTEAYRKTVALAEEAVSLAGPSAGLVAEELADAACGAALGDYMALELAWLGGLGRLKLQNKVHRTLQNRELILDFLSMNEEAVKRCTEIMPKHAVPAAVRFFFYPSTTSTGTTGTTTTATTTAEDLNLTMLEACLLGQVAAHVLLGLRDASERCVLRLTGPFRFDPGANRDAAARGDAAVSIGTLLQSIFEAGEVAVLLKRHYDEFISPFVAPAPTEAAACADGVAMLVAALDQRTSSALEKMMTQLFRRIAATMVAEQLKTDFKPASSGGGGGGGGASSFLSSTTTIDILTDACLSAVALLKAFGEQASAHLHGTNYSSFLAAFARRTVSVVESHALKFTFSPEGALRWRRDLVEFGECMKGLGARSAVAAFDDLYTLAGLLIVPPESLPGLLDAVGHLERWRVKSVVERRADWRSAKIGKKSIAVALFSSGSSSASLSADA